MPGYVETTDSARGGSPVQLFTFTGRDSTEYYTNYDLPLIVDDNHYVAVDIQPGKPQVDGTFDADFLSLKVPTTFPIVQRFAVLSPNYRTFVDISEYHTTDPDEEIFSIWYGVVRGVKINSIQSEINLESGKSLFARLGLRRIYQNLCNHILGDDECRVNLEMYKTISTVTFAQGLTIKSPQFASKPDNWFAGGKLVTTRDEQRLVVKHVGDTITVLAPFPKDSLNINDTVNAYAGCAHDWGTCIGKYGNEVNYGGFPWMTEENIWVLPFRI